MQEKKPLKNFKNGDVRKYLSKYSVTLTKSEGKQLDKIIDDNGCRNLSQLFKKACKRYKKPLLVMSNNLKSILKI